VRDWDSLVNSPRTGMPGTSCSETRDGRDDAPHHTARFARTRGRTNYGKYTHMPNMAAGWLTDWPSAGCWLCSAVCLHALADLLGAHADCLTDAARGRLYTAALLTLRAAHRPLLRACNAARGHVVCTSPRLREEEDTQTPSYARIVEAHPLCSPHFAETTGGGRGGVGRWRRRAQLYSGLCVVCETAESNSLTNHSILCIGMRNATRQSVDRTSTAKGCP
jgi:hypothetical protein